MTSGAIRTYAQQSLRAHKTMAELSVTFTGLAELEGQFAKSPEIVEAAVQKALGLSLAEVEHQSKERTPVATGLLQGSIGGAGGYSYIKGLSAGIGTNVVYAGYVEDNEKAHHNNGEAHYMEHGVEAATPFIEKVFGDAMNDIAVKLTEKN